MDKESYKLGGWLGIIGAILAVPGFTFGFLYNLQTDLLYNLLPAFIGLVVIESCLWIYTFLKFRRMLNVKYQFHDVDSLIITLIIGGVLMTAVSTAGMAFRDLEIIHKLPFMAAAATIGTPLGIVGLIYSFKLLRLNGNLGGWLKPIAYTQMAAFICFATFILSPLGFLPMIAAFIFMCISLINSEQPEFELEFV